MVLPILKLQPCIFSSFIVNIKRGMKIASVSTGSIYPFGYYVIIVAMRVGLVDSIF